MKIPWKRRSNNGGQTAENLAIGRDFVMINTVDGPLSISLENKPYKLANHCIEPSKIDPNSARQQPSKLLLAKFQVVPFIGRIEEFESLNEWLETPESLSVRLYYGKGGQGKTRLAQRIAEESSSKGWHSFNATHTADSSTGPHNRSISAAGSVLIIVDYADRWPLSHLHALVSDFNLGPNSHPYKVRILMLARSARSWWPALAGSIDSELGVESDSTELRPLETATLRAEIIATAAASFADALALEFDSKVELHGSPLLFDGELETALSMHMAALVAVDAYHRGEEMPANQIALSAYLLRREFAYWGIMHEQRLISTNPDIMQRSAITATLTGQLGTKAASMVLDEIGLASSKSQAMMIIDDYQRCYPSDSEMVALDPMQPDRLGEDFLALAIPGNTLPTNLGIGADRWISNAIPELLTIKGRDTVPIWIAHAITVLVETAHRWPHVSKNTLFPLLRKEPSLAIAGGAATLIRLVDLPDIDPTILDKLDHWIPDDPAPEFQVAAEAINAALVTVRDELFREPVERAAILSMRANRLSNVGRYTEALECCDSAIEELQSPGLLNSDLNTLLIGSLNQRAALLHALKKFDLAVESANNAVALLRCTPNVPLLKQAQCLSNLAALSSSTGDYLRAKSAGLEAITILRELPSSDSDDVVRILLAALSNYGTTLTSMGFFDEALAIFGESVKVAKSSKVPPSLRANPIQNYGTTLNYLGRHREAAIHLTVSVSIFEQLAKVNPAIYGPAQGSALNALAETLLSLELHAPAAQIANESVNLFESLPTSIRTVHDEEYASALEYHGMALSGLTHGGESVQRLDKALALRERLSRSNIESRLKLSGTLLNMSRASARAGNRERAAELCERAVSVLKTIDDSEAGRVHLAIGQALSEYAFLCALLKDRMETGIAAAEQSMNILASLDRRFPNTLDKWLNRTRITYEVLNKQRKQGGSISP
ncbi:tetratricopeptide repeat protein [Nocardia sp. NPDC056000]|uniref:tetratricopeptide repeat protein n=1 Tax=Nocardia sp. NPDC056000 TaxID=3345674 RepID=UPI0035D7D8BA